MLALRVSQYKVYAVGFSGAEIDKYFTDAVVGRWKVYLAWLGTDVESIFLGDETVAQRDKLR